MEDLMEGRERTQHQDKGSNMKSEEKKKTRDKNKKEVKETS